MDREKGRRVGEAEVGVREGIKSEEIKYHGGRERVRSRKQGDEKDIRQGGRKDKGSSVEMTQWVEYTHEDLTSDL